MACAASDRLVGHIDRDGIGERDYAAHQQVRVNEGYWVDRVCKCPVGVKAYLDIRDGVLGSIYERKVELGEIDKILMSIVHVHVHIGYVYRAVTAGYGYGKIAQCIGRVKVYGYQDGAILRKGMDDGAFLVKGVRDGAGEGLIILGGGGGGLRPLME